jgi:methyl-accepting chemotaxis protein
MGNPKCWEVLKCPQDRKESCKAFPDNGTKCYTVTGTMCKGVKQGSPLKKLAECEKCSYYQKFMKG